MGVPLEVSEQAPRRRLAAVLAADVVGYSRLMQSDEAGTLAALKSRRSEVLQPLVSKHHGRVVKLMGDGVLVEFASAVDAVECAVQLQQGMESANAGLSKDQRIVLRVGVNLGDIIVEGSDLYGDGVNIAARLEALAEPGSVCVSQTVFSHVRGKVQIGFRDLGEHSLKNMVEPVRVYGVTGLATIAASSTLDGVSSLSRPSIAVLPFANLSVDRDQQYLSDGITEDIITELSRYKELFVIARNSSFQFRNNSADMKRVGKELGAEYLVEGSLRKVGDRIRVTAQLIEASSGTHLWADRYDRELAGIFEIQDEVTQTIAATLVGQLSRTRAERARRKPTELWAAYDYFLRGTDYTIQWDASAAIPLLRRAIELDPTFTQAYAELALACLQQRYLDGNEDALDMALAYARKGLEIDDNDGGCHAAMGLVETHLRQFNLAEAHSTKAIALNPNSVHFAALNAYRLSRCGQAREALAILDTIARHDPLRPQWYNQYQGWFLFEDRRYEEAIDTLSRVSPLQYWDHVHMAAAYAYLGRDAAARAEASAVLQMQPRFTISWWSKMFSYKNAADAEHALLGLRRAGLPEN
jgi:TolB-like protein/class 3 adenylate cyclase/Flp pilus assembly protein TadD